jgi:hypothetical protein
MPCHAAGVPASVSTNCSQFTPSWQKASWSPSCGPGDTPPGAVPTHWSDAPLVAPSVPAAGLAAKEDSGQARNTPAANAARAPQLIRPSSVSGTELPLLPT